MVTHHFPEVAKIQRFCFTLIGEARLWYESLRPTVVGCTGYMKNSDNSIQNVVIHKSNYSIYGDHFIMMIIHK